MKALVGAFNQEKALVGAFSVIVHPVVEPMDRFTALHKADNLKAMPLFPSTKRHLQDCRGPRCVGHADNIHKLMVARLDSADAAFLMSSPDPQPFDIKVITS